MFTSCSLAADYKLIACKLPEAAEALSKYRADPGCQHEGVLIFSALPCQVRLGGKLCGKQDAQHPGHRFSTQAR